MTAIHIWRRLRSEMRLWELAAWRGLVRLIRGNDFTHAAAIAYYALLSFFPFLLLVISLLGVVAADEADRTAVLNFALQYFPSRPDFVTSQLDAFRAARVPLGIAGGLALIWASLGVFGAVTSAVNEAWGVRKQRSFWQHRLVSFLLLAAAGGVMLAALLLVSAVQVAQATWIHVVPGSAGWITEVRTVAFRAAAIALPIVAVGVIFYALPNARIRFRDVWVGAVLTGLLWRLAFEGFSWYLGAGGRVTMIHGSIAAVVMFLFWIYISAVILMYGVEFTAAYARLSRHRPEAIPAAPSPRV